MLETKYFMWKRPAAIILFLVNLFPIYGVIFWKWGVFYLVFLYWLENVIIGIFNVLKIACSQPAQITSWLAKIFIIPFFCVHYGMFCFVHGLFVVGLFGKGFTGELSGINNYPQMVVNILNTNNLNWALSLFIFSHGFSFLYNYLYHKEYQTRTIEKLMADPYKRIVVLHLGIIFGGFLAMSLGSPTIAMLILIIVKVTLDLLAHIKEHKRTELSAAAVKS